jgi:hypothetical protein
MSKLSDKFNRLSRQAKFWYLFAILFVLDLSALLLVLHDGRRIFPSWSDFQFVLFGVVLCAGYAALLAGCGVYCERFVRRK